MMGITFLGLEMATDPTDSLFTTEVYASTNQIGTANITIDIADWESGVERHFTSSNGTDMYVHWNSETSASIFIDNGNGYTETTLYDGISRTGSTQASLSTGYVAVNYNIVDSRITTVPEDVKVTTDTMAAAVTAEFPFSLSYQAHISDIGWQADRHDGELSGTEGKAKRLEAIEIKLVEKNGEAHGPTTRPFEKYPTVSYQTHVQNIGWQNDVRNGESSGTTGRALRLEGIKIQLTDLPYAGSISYSTHIQNIGWQNDVNDGLLSGTSGQGLRLEAIKIKLDGEMAQNFDIYYRVHAQIFGWTGWAKNGEPAGTAEYGYRLEAIQIKMIPKGSEAPGKTTGAFMENPKVVLNVPFVSQLTPTYAPMGCEGASLLMGLQYKSYTSASLKSFLDNMPKNSINPFESFASSPYKIVNGVFQSIFPEALAAYGKTYSGKVADATGISTAQLKAEIKQGNPVVVYVTNNFTSPIWGIFYMGSAGYVRTIDNMHVMTLIGYDEGTGAYLVNDPNSYTKNQYWVKKDKFEKTYDALKYAIVVR